MDGESLRAGRTGTFAGCVRPVGTWATAQGLSLGRVAVVDESNEVPGIPVHLKTLDVKSCLITIDAAGYHEEIVNAIRHGGVN